MHGTLNHLLFADLMWMPRFEAQERPRLKMGEIIHDDFADLRAARADMDTRIWPEQRNSTSQACQPASVAGSWAR
jgi:uncharacterized damage-inducible protein DinB